MKELTYTNIAQSERVARIALGVGLIIDVVNGSGPLGSAALIPLASIYPVMTGFLGFDPIYAMFGFSTAKDEQTKRNSQAYRISLKANPVLN